MTRRSLGLLLTVPLLGLPSCGGGGGGGGGPTGPPPPPTVSAVTPAEARAGEQVTIAGSNFGSSAAAVTVTFRGEAAAVGAVSDASITTTVPDIAPGDAAVVVTVSGRTSDPADFRVLQSPPVVTSVEPNPVRAGETLVIRGRNFTAAPNGLRAAQNGVQVMIGARILEVDEVFSDRIGVTLPLDLDPGASSLTVRVGDLASDPFSIEIRVFSLQGFWWPSMDGSVDFNDCGFGAAVGSPFLYGFTLTDDGTGSLGGFYNGIDLMGTLGLDDGAFGLSGSINGTTVEGDGTTGTGSDGLVSLDLRFDFVHVDQQCRIGARISATRLTEEPLRYAAGFSAFDDLHQPGQSVTPVTGDHDLDIVDAVAAYRLGSLRLSITGESFAFPQGQGVLLDFARGSLTYGLKGADIVGIDDPVPGPFCQWAPLNNQTVTAELIDDLAQSLISRQFPPGNDVRMQLPFHPEASDARYSADDDGFTSFQAAYSGFFNGLPPQEFDASMAEICDLTRRGYGGY